MFWAKKKDFNQSMNVYEKLIFIIWEYIAHADEYKSQSKMIFWDIICKLLKDEIGYNIQKPRVTIMW